MIGNNYLKQLAFGARANSPVPVCRLWNGFPSEARISRLSVTICRRQKKRGRVSPRTSLKVVFASCSGCFQSQNAWVRNAPDVLWQYFVMPSRQWDGSENVPFYDVTRFLNRARPPLTHRADWYADGFGCASRLRVQGSETPMLFISTSLHVLCLFLLALFLPQIENGFLYLNLMVDDSLKLRSNVYPFLIRKGMGHQDIVDES